MISVIAYVAERGRPGLWLPAAASIALAPQIGHSIDLVRLASSAAFALLLIGQFRLWDDLADIERDRIVHPRRVLSCAYQLDSFVVLGLTMAVANLAIAASIGGAASVVILILLDAAMATWYAARPRRRLAIADLFILTKYPTFTFILAGSASPSTPHAAAAVGIYIVACVFEIWHDASSPLRTRVHL